MKNNIDTTTSFLIFVLIYLVVCSLLPLVQHLKEQNHVINVLSILLVSLIQFT